MKALLTPKRLLQALAVIIGLGLGLAAVRQNATAREVMGEAFAGLFGFFTTPFILEVTVALVGLISVISYNQWRISQEGDGWVTLPESEASTEPSIETAVARDNESSV
jgi:hypothetical protein